MTVIDVLKIAVVYLGKDEYLNITDFGGTLVKTAQQEKDIDSMVRCLNLVIKELATDILPIKKEELLIAENNKILHTSLDCDVLDFVSVKTKLGETINFKEFSDYISVPNGEYYVCYTYLPDNVEINDDIPSFLPKLTARCLALGLVKEYLFVSSLFDDANVFCQRFNDSLAFCKQSLHEKILPRRRWL